MAAHLPSSVRVQGASNESRALERVGYVPGNQCVVVISLSAPRREIETMGYSGLSHNEDRQRWVLETTPVIKLTAERKINSTMRVNCIGITQNREGHSWRAAASDKFTKDWLITCLTATFKTGYLGFGLHKFPTVTLMTKNRIGVTMSCTDNRGVDPVTSFWYEHSSARVYKMTRQIN